MEDVLLKNDCHHDTTLNAVHANYDCFLDEQTFKDISNKAIIMLAEKKATKILVDTSGMKVIPKENQEWIQGDWFPRAIQAGLKTMAFITPRNIFGEVSTKATNQKVEDEQLPVSLEYFYNKEEAVEWLNNN